MGSDSDILDEKHHAHQVSVKTREVDTAAELAAGGEANFDPAEALRIRCVEHNTVNM
ncbi:hypothetical protein HGRIS_007419 [Hohenbuehelia grisea]|uniref:Uncharacterized protein n=1 Tax=Hohenbuehelia grisea TaxID=104357 RepID=A0ABR3J4R8_9AGAR